MNPTQYSNIEATYYMYHISVSWTKQMILRCSDFISKVTDHFYPVSAISFTTFSEVTYFLAGLNSWELVHRSETWPCTYSVVIDFAMAAMIQNCFCCKFHQFYG